MQGDNSALTGDMSNVREVKKKSEFCIAGEEDCGINPLWVFTESDLEHYFNSEFGGVEYTQ